ncbi:winged helix-turn-helix domain-containing protein [Jiangella asiatica]|uniref:winged helix-turn-helix domain-containing protein n=1 Tax=Jiangella asiatica TaxID=2530372 RepID=UPI00193D29E6|nr:winged helix-turn-helix domain-containing protein [Jiangella asiatica]
MTLDPTNRRAVTPAGVEVAFTPLEAAVLAYLMNRPGRVCSRDELMCEALGYSVPVGSRTVDVHIAALRSKLGDAVRIRSVRGVGYRLEPAAKT